MEAQYWCRDTDHQQLQHGCRIPLSGGVEQQNSGHGPTETHQYCRADLVYDTKLQATVQAHCPCTAPNHTRIIRLDDQSSKELEARCYRQTFSSYNLIWYTNVKGAFLKGVEMFTWHSFHAGLQPPRTSRHRPAYYAWYELHPGNKWGCRASGFDSSQATLCLTGLRADQHNNFTLETRLQCIDSTLLLQHWPLTVMGLGQTWDAWDRPERSAVEGLLWSVMGAGGARHRHRQTQLHK